MASIHFSLDPTKPLRIQDHQSDAYPELHHAWIQLHDREQSSLTLSMGHGVPTDEEIVAGASMLIVALDELRDAARARIADREWIAAAKAAREPVGAIAGLTPDEGDHFVRESAA